MNPFSSESRYLTRPPCIFYPSYNVAKLFHFQQLLQNCMYSNENFEKLESVYAKKLQQILSLNTKLKSAEEEIKVRQKEAAEANFCAEKLERKWSKASHKLAEMEKELEALCLDFAGVL